MKLLNILLIFFLFSSCSFDNKTGIWKDANDLSNDKSKTFIDFKKLGVDKEKYDEEVNLKNNYNFNIPQKISHNKWEDIYYNKFNNYDNFAYNEEKKLILKSKKISRHKLNEHFLYDEGNLIAADERGNLIIFSLEKNQIVLKFNFYKKQYSKLKKNLNIVLSKSIIYVSDNLGFIYAFDYKKNQIIWAKNNKIPFRSNLKIDSNKLIAADQNNRIYFFEKNNGNLLKLIPTEETKIKNNFKNNFTLNNETIFMINTYGSLYSIDNKENKVNWVSNLNQSLDVNTSNLFNGHQLINNNDYIIVSSQDSTYIMNSKTGNINDKLNITSVTKPLLIDNLLFLISSNNLFVCLDISTSEVVYSFKINNKIAEYLDIKKKKASFDDIIFANNKILVLLQTGYIVEFEVTGKLKDIYKLPSRINSKLLFINNSILYVNNKNRIILLG